MVKRYKTKKNNKKKNQKTKQNTKRFHHQYGSGKGNDLRAELVRLCKKNEWEEYDKITQSIIDDWVKGDKSFFIYLDKQIKTFKPETLRCLERSLTRLQEEAIPESMEHLHYILTHRNS